MKWLAHFLNAKPRRYEMDLEKVALEAVKIKIGDIFDKITVTTVMEGRDIVLRISLPSEIMKYKETDRTNLQFMGNSNLDKEAQAAANELLGLNESDT